MPAPAFPTPRADTTGHAVLRRVYRDVLGRPMTGTVTLTGSTPTASGDARTLPAPVRVELVGGLLQVALPPDTYRLQADLRTVDGARVTDTDQITLEAS